MLTEGITEVKLCIVSYYYFHPSPCYSTPAPTEYWHNSNIVC